MTTIAILSQKGGAGKSTLARALAVAALEDGRRSAIIDADPQGTIVAWASRRVAKAPAVVALDGQPLDATAARWRQAGAEVIVIDTPPHARAVIALAAELADVVLIPVRPSPDDLAAVGPTVEIVRALNRPYGIVFNAAPPRGAALALARAALSAFGHVCPIAVVERLGHQYAAAEGLTVLEREPKSNGAEEIRAVWRWLLDRS
ncbi:MAG: ParA family protein [Alphaproteobacteria bacterium]|nr:ParA family protein [Alphaproteobacteria bacterium]MBF0372146.1 ParA family protein [Alphaproteobacteria bacterium]